LVAHEFPHPPEQDKGHDVLMYFSPLRTFRNATGETSKSPKAGHCSDQSQNAHCDHHRSLTFCKSGSPSHSYHPQITNKLLQITPESPHITTRSPQITSKAAPDHARDAEDHGQAAPDHARVAADHSHTRAQATQATDDGRRRCAVGGSPRRHGPRPRLHGQRGARSHSARAWRVAKSSTSPSASP
jgi:hypothetical protein